MALQRGLGSLSGGRVGVSVDRGDCFDCPRKGVTARIYFEREISRERESETPDGMPGFLLRAKGWEWDYNSGMREFARTMKGLGFLLPWLVGFGCFLLLPIVMSFYYSFCDYSLVPADVSARFVGARNYVELLHDALFWKVLGNTLMYSALAIPAGLLVSLVLALLLNTRVPGQAMFRTVIFLPSLVPAVAAAVLWAWLFNSRLGLINTMLRWAHLPAPNWLGDTRFALPALALMSLWSVGYTVVILLAGLQGVPRELYEAADIDGANWARRLWHVTLPTLSPVIFFNLIMSLIASFQVFTIPYLMTLGGPAHATYFCPMYLV